MRIVGRALFWLGWPVAILGTLWGAAALWFDGPPDRVWAGVAAGVLVLVVAGVLGLVRPVRRALLVTLILLFLVAVWWQSIPPRNDRDWYPDVARLPRAGVENGKIRIENVRNFEYRSETDYTERWENRTYDLDHLRGVDLFLSFWGPTAIAHTIASWEFENAPPLAISIETRKEKGEEYSAVRGFFRQYELYYVVADERDVVGLRTNFRGEQVFLYHIRMRPEAARALLLDYLKEINSLFTRPRWYNALTQNCTTTIRLHTRAIGLAGSFDWRLLANGRLDELGYERGQIDTSLAFAEMRARSDITERARRAGIGPDFSQRIRDGLPGGHPATAQESPHPKPGRQDP